MSARKTTRAKPAPHFVLLAMDLPIAGIAPPLACPFCGHDDQVGIEFSVDKTGMPEAHVQCGCCGTEAGYTSSEPDDGIRTHMDVARKAAAFWNTRAPIAGVRQ